jgi:hypothetical protein
LGPFIVKIVVSYSKGLTEATEAALHEAQLEDALPTEVKLAAGKPIFSYRPKRSKDAFRICILCTSIFVVYI